MDDYVVARSGYESIWPWICLSSATRRVGLAVAESRASRKPRPPKTYMLTDGAQIGLGALLEERTHPPAGSPS